MRALEAGEMAQQLKACYVFAEDASLVPSTRFVQIIKKK